MEKHVENVYKQFLNTLNSLAPVKRLTVKNPSAVAEALKAALIRLKQHFDDNPFEDALAEVRFFKYEKPLFRSEYLFALEIYNIESNRPVGDLIVLRNYYENELAIIRRFFDRYRFLYQYYQLDGTEFDNIYFTHYGNSLELTLPQASEATATFSTPGEFVFSKFIAFERVQEYLIDMVYPCTQLPVAVTGNAATSLKWTGDKVNLIELAYGIYDTGQLNDGMATVAEIVAWFEASLHIKLDRYFQVFSEIKRRKTISKTRYIDHMAVMLQQHIEDADEFKPQKPPHVSGSRGH